MKILLTNDDGINAYGINALYEALSNKFEVTMVAPKHENSGLSHSFTITRALSLEFISHNRYTCDGTPVDCVKLAVDKIFSYKNKPDFVISGINHGTNLGRDLFYSGTFAAALEGNFLGIPSIAISSNNDFKFNSMKIVAEKFLKIFSKILQQFDTSFLKNFTLNINIPLNPRGIKITTINNFTYYDTYKKIKTFSNKSSYILKGHRAVSDYSNSTDLIAYENGYITITPVEPVLSSPKINSFKNLTAINLN